MGVILSHKKIVRVGYDNNKKLWFVFHDIGNNVVAYSVMSMGQLFDDDLNLNIDMFSDWYQGMSIGPLININPQIHKIIRIGIQNIYATSACYVLFQCPTLKLIKRRALKTYEKLFLHYSCLSHKYNSDIAKHILKNMIMHELYEYYMNTTPIIARPFHNFWYNYVNETNCGKRYFMDVFKNHFKDEIMKTFVY